MRIEAPEQSQEPGLAIATKITASQQAILDQLHNHVAFSESLIFLSGPPGAGKSTILEVFLEQASDYANLAYLPQPSKINADAMRSKILRQLVSLDAFSTDDRILEALQRNMKPGRQHLVVCVDNGESLPAAILSELQELATSRHLFKPDQRVSVVIAGSAEWIKRASKGLSLGSKEPASRIEVSPFSKREQASFARKLVETQSKSIPEEKLSAVLQQTQGYPGEIQQALETLLLKPKAAPRSAKRGEATSNEKGAAKAPKSGSALNKLLLLMTVIAFALALYVAWMLHEGQPGDREPESLPVETEVETSNEPEPAPAGQETPPVVVEPADDGVAMDYDQAITRLRERSSQRQEQASVEELTAPLSEQPDTITPAPVAEQPAEASASADASDEAETAYDNQELWQRNAQRYVLQVAAFSDAARLELFLNEFSHPQLRIYQTLRDDESWYFVVVGDYPSAQAARDYVAEQSEQEDSELQGLQPWPKSIAGVRQDLAPVMGDNAAATN
ncbi:hypothetical protein CWE12_09335 [Aliidiomarina sedimenti]|uniref:SPOR domain-containing protein n=1 Tax=Aliidiomarina sedimenti TaxID=1933879 RepID=A0ABY0BXH2_9GAMM|nr:AAA family ATPase [Aliidiomarina sedimenti]RUO29179.1 hypothetical protein CWE12_09335 [Aliidiomarina sedimenti]